MPDSDYLMTPISLCLNGEKGQSSPTAHESMGLTSNTCRSYSPIYTLNEDVLLNVFDVYRLADLDEDEDEDGGRRIYWYRQRWWYKLVHVCRLWRNLILSSPSRLDLHLFCTYGVPIADMLAHSPPLPLIIYYHHDWQVDQRVTTEDEPGILLALSHRDRVRRVSFRMPSSSSSLGKYIIALDGQFPVLDRMFIDPLGPYPLTNLAFPLSFQAPNLRHLDLWATAFLQVQSPSVTTTAAGLVTLKLVYVSDPPSAHFPPSYMLTRLSNMPQLETLVIDVSRYYEESDSGHTPNITLSKLHSFVFRGASTYLEGLVSRISAPSLSIFKFHVDRKKQHTFPTPSLLRFMQTSENFSVNAVKFIFNWSGFVEFVMLSSRRIPILHFRMTHGNLGWQVTSALQILSTFSPVLSVVEQIMLGCRTFPKWPDNESIDRTQWRELLGFFSNAKTLYVQDWLVFDICRSLKFDDGELPPRLLPNLRELGYSMRLERKDARAALTAFIDERQVVGHPVNLTVVDESVFFRPIQGMWGAHQ